MSHLFIELGINAMTLLAQVGMLRSSCVQTPGFLFELGVKIVHLRAIGVDRCHRCWLREMVSELANL